MYFSFLSPPVYSVSETVAQMDLEDRAPSEMSLGEKGQYINNHSLMWNLKSSFHDFNFSSALLRHNSHIIFKRISRELGDSSEGKV